MQAQLKLGSGRSKAALVVVFPPGVKGLFNPEVHGLVREVEERLDGVYVTYALSSGTSPSLRDAMAAARFVGCESAVVVPTASDVIVKFVDRETSGDWMVTSTPDFSELDASAVVEAYRAAVAGAGKAA
jgi:hypothetical protein